MQWYHQGIVEVQHVGFIDDNIDTKGGDEENRLPAYSSEADLMARFSSTGGCRYNNDKDMVALLAMYIIILHILCPNHRRPRLHHPGANSKVSPSSGSSCPHSPKTYLLLASSCSGVANLVFRGGGWVFGKVYSFEDYKESRGQGHKGSSDQKFWRGRDQ